MPVLQDIKVLSDTSKCLFVLVHVQGTLTSNGNWIEFPGQLLKGQTETNKMEALGIS